MSGVINGLLERTTGYRLVNTQRATRVAHDNGINRLNAAAARLEQAVAEIAPGTAKAKPKAKPKGTGLPADFDDEAVEIIKQVSDRTMTGPEKLYGLISAVRYVHRHDVPGAIVECGVWRGGSMQAVARTLDVYGDYTRDLYLFDTFEGMPPPTQEDVRVRDGRSAEQLLEAASNDSWVKAIASLDDVRSGFADVPYPKEKVHYVQGMVEDTIPGEAPDEIAILRLDTDWYASTKHEFEHLYQRLSSGGVLIIDDYGWWDGSRRATEEFLDKTSAPLLLMRAGSGRIAVKP